jgi:potassium/chloride transporter 9
VILNTVPAWKRVYKLRVAVFVEYESDVEEERGRVQSLLENLRIEAEVLVFWLASGKLNTYEIIVNGASPGKEYEDEVDECLKEQEWWDEIQKIRGKKDGISAAEDLSDIASIFTTGSNWPEASFQQGPRGERVERFLGLRRLLRKSKRKHTLSGIAKLGVSLGMRTHRLSPDVVRQHASQGSASEDSGSESDDDSDSVAGESDGLSEGPESAASEADIDDFESESDSPNRKRLIRRRRSHGDSIGGPPPSKKSTGEREVKVPNSTQRRPLSPPSLGFASASNNPASDTGQIPDLTSSIASLQSQDSAARPASISNIQITSKKSKIPSEAASNKPSSIQNPAKPSSIHSVRPALSRYASTPKFTSKPVPATHVASEDGPGPSIMFTDTPSPPQRRGLLPSAYRSRPTSTAFPDHISEISESYHSTTPSSRRGSTYSTQALPLSFNDLPSRAQHLILNELMRKKSQFTAVIFTTLPSPVEGTCKSEEASRAYLGDLEILCKGCPPVLMIHSNSMTVTMSL